MPTPVPPTLIGRRLLAIDQSRIWLAFKVGVSESTVSLWISGYRNPNARHIKRIARLLGVTVQELLDDLHSRTPFQRDKAAGRTPYIPPPY